MVSFSCENCNDILTKKKLDAHHRQCQGSSFTCLDCMTHFVGTEYRQHTSCISEDQKYQGALYKEKPSKESKKPAKTSEPHLHRKAYVEDATDPDTGNAVSIVNAPPPAPTPPAAPSKAQPINVFDFLVVSDIPNASKIGPVEPKMVLDDTPVLKGRPIEDRGNKQETIYQERGFTYGSDPVPLKNGRPETEYYTPAPKHLQNASQEYIREIAPSDTKPSDKKRKRLPASDLDLAMSDAPAPILHSGLTGGLNRLLSKSAYPPDPDFAHADDDPLSPAKRSKKTYRITESGTTEIAHSNTKEKGKTRERTKAPSTTGELIRVRKRRTSDESRPHKQHRSHHSPSAAHSHAAPSSHREHKSKEHPRPRAIQYHSASHLQNQSSELQQKQLIKYKSRAELFMSFVTKGPESEGGCSVHKALKRYHRERGGEGAEKGEEEKELFRGLRLKKNERGEVVVFF